MPRLLSWIREVDDAVFGRWFAGAPQVEVHNARLTTPDLDSADAFLITGGPDIAREFLQQPVPDESLIRSPDPTRDAWEFAAVRRALDRGLPLLCICKGMQLLNVALGGTLRLDIPGHNLPGQKDGDVQPLRHATHAAWRFARVNSSHHQALDRLGAGLEVEAWHADDGVVEQVRLKPHPWAFGVQYHPERGAQYAPLFAEFFAQFARE